MHLHSPLLAEPKQPNNDTEAGKEAALPLDHDALAALSSLGWVEAAALQPARPPCQASCCQLPAVHICSQEAGQNTAGFAGSGLGHKPEGLAGFGRQSQPAALPADSEVTVASPGAAICNNTVLSSPWLQGQQQPLACFAQRQPSAAGAIAADMQASAECADQAVSEQPADLPTAFAETDANAPAGPALAELLAQGVARVAERSQGSSDVVTPQQLLRRRWASVSKLILNSLLRVPQAPC
jgi:hypothetical protein